MGAATAAAAGGGSDGASDIFTAVSVCTKNRERRGRCVYVSGGKAGTMRTFYIQGLYISSAADVSLATWTIRDIHAFLLVRPLFPFTTTMNETASVTISYN